MGFSRKLYWSGLPFPPSVNLSDPGLEPASPIPPALARGFFTTELPGRHIGSIIRGQSDSGSRDMHTSI